MPALRADTYNEVNLMNDSLLSCYSNETLAQDY